MGSQSPSQEGQFGSALPMEEGHIIPASSREG